MIERITGTIISSSKDSRDESPKIISKSPTIDSKGGKAATKQAVRHNQDNLCCGAIMNKAKSTINKAKSTIANARSGTKYMYSSLNNLHHSAAIAPIRPDFFALIRSSISSRNARTSP